MASWRSSPAARWLLAAVIVAAAIVVLPPTTTPGFLTVAASLLITAQLVLGVDLLFASIKHMSLVHVALMGIAAYLMLGLQSHWHWGFWPAFGGALVGCLVAAVVIASFVFRASGYYFAILTFVVSEVIVLSFNNLTSITGGSGGLFKFTNATLFGLQLGSGQGIFQVIGVATLLMFLYVWAIRRSSLGRKASAIGDNEPLARAVGMPASRIKQMIFIASALPTAVAGALYATSVGAIQPTLFGPQLGVAVVLMALLGGSGYLAGPLIGAAIYVGLPEIIPISPEVGTGVVGLLFIVLIRVSPGGIADGLARLGKRWLTSAGRSAGSEADPVGPDPSLTEGVRGAL
jgi:branched-chain amino acid transport system permease protein